MVDPSVRSDPIWRFRSTSISSHYYETDRANPSIHAADTTILSLTSINVSLSVSLFHAPSRPFTLFLLLTFSLSFFLSLSSYSTCTAKQLLDHSASTLRSLIPLITVTTRFNGHNCGLLRLIKTVSGDHRKVMVFSSPHLNPAPLLYPSIYRNSDGCHDLKIVSKFHTHARAGPNRTDSRVSVSISNCA